MPDEPLPRATPDQFWGTIRAAASAGLTRQETFDAIAARAEQLGMRLPAVGAVGFNSLIASAGGLQRAVDALTYADSSSTIRSSMVHAYPYGEASTRLGGPRVFDVRVSYSATYHGEPVDRAVTLRYTGGLPPTVGDLRAEAFDIAQSLVAGYDVEGVELGQIEIAEV